MAKGKADISNSAIRMFLQKIGEAYDRHRGLQPFKPTPSQWAEVMEFFDNKCCYCGQPVTSKSAVKDHLIPINKEALGLHAWGNVVPSCYNCNRKKHNKDWQSYLEDFCSPENYLHCVKSIKGFMLYYSYDPNLELEAIADNLYADIGAVAMTLIDLRFHQAQEVIERQLKTNESKKTKSHKLGSRNKAGRGLTQ